MKKLLALLLLYSCTLVPSAEAQNVDFLASTNSATATAKILLGKSEGASSGNVSLFITNIPAYLAGANTVHVLTERIPDNGLSALTALTTVINSDYTVVGNAITVTLASMGATDGYSITLTPGKGGTPPAPLSTTATVTVNMALDGGPVTYRASGFLHAAFLASAPTDAFVTPIKPRLIRCAESALAGTSNICANLYARATALGATVQVIVSDHIYSAPWPGDGGNWASWESRCAAKVNAAIAAGRTYQWDIWNEYTNATFWAAAGGQSQWHEAWKRCVDVIRGIQPGAVIVGPSIGPFEEDETALQQFLTYAKANNVLPNILSWHEFETDARRGSQIPGNIAAIRAYMTANNISVPQIQINEMILEGEAGSSGRTIRYLSNIERTEAVGAAHACWADAGTSSGDNCFNNPPNLNGLLTTAGTAARSSWWAYKVYGDFSGRMVGFAPPGTEAILDDFSVARTNDCSNCEPFAMNLWHAVSADQAFSVSNGQFHDTGGPSEGVYFRFFPRGAGGYFYPANYAQSFLTSGGWNPAFNRMRIEMKCNAAHPRFSNYQDQIQWGTYVRAHDESDANNQGQHYYHLFNPNIYAGKWIQLEINPQPQHRVGGDPSFNWQLEPEINNTTGSSAVSYMDGLTHIYPVDTQGAGWDGETCDVDNAMFRYAPKEPDGYVASTWATHSGSIYDIGWAGHKQTATTYTVRYSTSQSLKTLGFSNGTSGGTVSTAVDTAWIRWTLTSAAVQTLYVGIRPDMNILSATGATPISLTFTMGHGLATGDVVSVASVCANANGTRTVTVVDFDTVTLNSTSGACSYTSGGTATATDNNSNFTEIQLGQAIQAPVLAPVSFKIQ